MKTEIPWQTRAGSGTGFAKSGGTLEVNVTSSTNVGSGEQDLHSYTLPANTLKTNKDRVVWEGFVQFAANSNSKTLRIKWGSVTTTTITSSNSDGLEIRFRFTIHRDGSNSQRLVREIYVDDTSGTFKPADVAVLTASSQTDTSDIIMKCTASAVSNSDIVQYTSHVEYHPAP